MSENRLYIDNVLVDIDENTDITMEIKSNLFRDVSSLVSNTTYTVKLPKTVNNQGILAHVDKAESSDSFPFILHTARYFHGGVEVIHDGRAVVLSVTSEAIEISIIWGIFSKYTDLISKGTKLNELESTDRILFNAVNTPYTYANAEKADYFYANYDVMVHDTTTDYTWKAGEVRISPESDFVDYSSAVNGAIISSGGFGGTVSNIDGAFLHPLVKVEWLLNLIESNTGIKFKFSGDALEYIKTLIIPLIEKKANELTLDEKFGANIEATDTKGTLNIDITTASDLFKESTGTVTELNVVSDADVIIDINAEWSFEITSSNNPSSSRSTTKNGVTTSWDGYTINNPYILVIGVTSGSTTDQYVMGVNASKFTVWVPAGYKGVVRDKYKGYGKISVKKDSKIQLRWVSMGEITNTHFYGGTMKATVTTGEYVTAGSYFPIAYNLPKIKVIDFIKFLCAVTGTYPLQMSDDGVVEFVSISTVWNNISKAIDWTEKLIASGTDNKPKSMEFKVGSYAQHNYYKWKDDDDVTGDYDGDVVISNDSLDSERTVIEFPFAACDNNNVPMYTKGDATLNTDGTTSTSSPSYNACSDRIMRLSEDSNSNAIAIFDINMQSILNEKYTELTKTLQMAKVVKEKMRLSAIEIVNFDETIPIYLAQYGRYYAVTEIKTDSDGNAEVTMLQLIL